jgi:mycothiol synthase
MAATELPSTTASLSNMDLPDGYAFRAPIPGDLDAVAAVLIADDLDDAGEVVLDGDFLLTGWNRPDFDLATDAWVIVDGADSIVAYGQVMRQEPGVVGSWGIVHPTKRGRGLGSPLLDRIEQRADHLLSGLPEPRFRHAINAGDSAAASMLSDRGLHPVRHFWHMGIDLDETVDPGRVPDQIEIGGIEPETDLPAVHAVLAEAFSEDWGYHPDPFDRWAEDYASGPNYDPMLWLVARDGAAMVGVLTASVSGDHAWVGEIGVLATHRGRGIAGALLRRSFETFAALGVRRVMLAVDAENPTGATALYEGVGMRIIKRWDLWERTSNGVS